MINEEKYFLNLQEIENDKLSMVAETLKTAGWKILEDNLKKNIERLKNELTEINPQEASQITFNQAQIKVIKNFLNQVNSYTERYKNLNK